MPEPTTRPRRARAVLAVVAGMGVLAACSGGHTSTAPKSTAGQATVIARLSGSTPVGKAVTTAPFTPGLLSMSSGSDGSLLMAVPGWVARLGPKGDLTPAATGSKATSPSGVVGLPDGSFVTGAGDQLMRIMPGQQPAPIAGARGAARSLATAPPSGGTASAVHFTRYLTPVGPVADGSLILADGDAAWRMRAGKLTRIYRGSLLGHSYAVTPDGTLYLVPEGSEAALRDTVVITPSGTAGRLKLPASVPGVSGDPGTLTPLSESSDGKNGLYVHAIRRGGLGTLSSAIGDYVLHLHGGTADLTVSSAAPGPARNCTPTGSAPALKFPCPLPQAVTSQPGLLVLAGGTTYAVGVHMPKA
ncbi:hypothetical protein POF50_006475 [Streptomyces sp. SL13]|uniref:ScyD/ScyE family protein n=1 Tax=Streptantibioticus silvisoli TaxID=2705255 RepID=A0AA90H6P7_9ACTN|nr:hypothetical protein [Streptantibioticus silvisoli]MDI5968992.1 hypothetical protein [Streptantibioticus silvisoli]